MLNEDDRKEITELVTDFGTLYVDLMFSPIKQIVEAKFHNLLVAAIPSLAN